MLRVQCIMLALLAAAGCVTVPADEPSDLDSRIDEALAEGNEPWGGERTGNVTLVVEKVSVDRSDAADLEMAWHYADEHVVARGGSVARRNGVRIGVALDGFRAAFRAALRAVSSQRIETTMITALTGTPASITVGEDRYVEALRMGQLTLFQQTLVGTSIVAIATILPGDKVSVRLYPRFTARDGQFIDVTTMETEVVAANAQTVVIGGTDQASDDVGAALFSWQQDHRERRVLLTVTPHIHGAP